MFEGVPESWFAPGAPPLEVDFGSHRGVFLTGMAALHPGTNFLGIERQSERVRKTLGKIERRGLRNAWAVRGEGTEALREGLPDQSIAVLHVSFPDPWPKRRHAGRRLVNPAFLREVWRVLRPGGVLRLMTDNEPYFREMEEAVLPFWSVVPWDDGRETVATSFELTFRALGYSPHRLAVRRPGVSPPMPIQSPPPAEGDDRPARASRTRTPEAVPEDH
ncbi:MAG: tRNA (guanosine(46)-N7)-methyltransferase TrmB [Terrimicrobiaceae bacterium]|nr:tRNA (guanosine(46)-N7)-methyltransferase TrmB [Terrimicrobiaceae bacterium]